MFLTVIYYIWYVIVLFFSLFFFFMLFIFFFLFFFFWLCFFFFFFFFQAEDGIRDKLVTGVQTCALPIYLAVDRAPARHDPLVALRVLGDLRDELAAERRVGDRRGVRALREPGEAEGRSEERRVGKECRSRWWPYH